MFGYRVLGFGRRSRALRSTGLNPFAIPNSCRFNDNDTAYTKKIVGAAATDDNKLFTISTLTKRGNLGVSADFAGASLTASGTFFKIGVNTSDQIVAGLFNATAWQLITTAKYRDPHAWYHIVFQYDSAQATAADRLTLWVNGVEVTDFGTRTDPSLNGNTRWNDSSTNWFVGSSSNATGGVNNPYDGYITEFINVDGLAKVATDFGEFDANGEWRPIDYAGAYGSGGFRLDATVAPGTGNGFGTDVSGNAFHFTDSGLAANDQVTDTPTNNFATLSPISTHANANLSNGNLKVIHTGGTGTLAVSSIAFDIATSELWAEFTMDNNTAMCGIVSISTAVTPNSIQVGDLAAGYAYREDGDKGNNNSYTAYGATFTTNDRIGIYINNGTIRFYKNGASQGDAFTSLTGKFYFATSGDNGRGWSIDFGQFGFVDTPPGSSVPLNTQNLSEPPIKDASAHVHPLKFTGTGASNPIVFGGNSPLNLVGDGGLVMIKDRDTNATDWVSSDTVRGATKELRPNTFDIERTEVEGIKSFDVDGVTLGTAGFYNQSSGIQALYAWGRGIKPGFDIVSYTGNGATTQTIAHNLGKVPKLIFVKNLVDTEHWPLYHEEMAASPEGNRLGWSQSDQLAADTAVWNNTAPTSSVFSVGNSVLSNRSGDAHIAYVFAEIPGFSKFGTYIGNGLAAGPVIWCGFRPAIVLIKNVPKSGRTMSFRDRSRNPFNPAGAALATASASAETENDALLGIDFLSTGFRVHGTDGDVNLNGDLLIFSAWAESPFGGDGGDDPAMQTSPSLAV